MAVKCRIIEGGYCEITDTYRETDHKGIDVVGPGYTLAWEVAHSDGVVVATRNNCTGYEPNGSYGNYVKIRHDDGYYTLYAHGQYNTVQVSVGQRVKRGQRIMYMGATGFVTAGHLHFEVRTPNDVRINPTPYLDADLPNNNQQVNVYYRVQTKEDGWLDEVKNLEDYAGLDNHPIIAVAIGVDKGSIWYQAHIKGGDWLPKVTGYDINEFYNGYAGDGREIDCIRVYYYTPSDIRPFKKAKYKVNNFAWQYDDEYDSNGENYAGVYGVNATEFRIIIE